MAQETLKGDWNIAKGKVKQQWGKLTDDDVNQIEGKRDELVGRVQRAYGRSKEEAEREVSEWERTHL